MGMSKLMINKFGDTAVTRDGAVILDMMDVYHPIAKFLEEAARSFESTVGDGTRTTIMLVGELVKRAEKLLQSKEVVIDKRLAHPMMPKRLST
jgi:chaperonin GroEL (HSP60 family)